MPLFGPSNPNSQGLMSRLFGGGGASPPQAPAAPSPTAAVAQQTGATASSPFLRYLQSNAPAAQQTAQSLMGAAPEPDYRSALIQAGLGILSQDGGQSPLQAIAKGAQTAMPLYLQEQERVKNYEQQVQGLAAKLNMSAADFDLKMKGERKGVKCFDGVCIDEDSYADELRANGGDMAAAFANATVHEKRPTAQANAKHLAQLRLNLQIQKTNPDSDPQELKMAQDELEAMEAQIMGKDESAAVTFGWMDANGSFRTATGKPSAVAQGVAQINNADTVKTLQLQQEATDQVLYYASNALDVFDKASVLSGGTLGKTASTVSAWSQALDETLSGPRADQFSQEVKGNPNSYVNKLRQDPESRNLLGEGFLDSLSEVGQDNAVALSNIVGLAYATARAEEPGGRLSNADVAAAMMSLGFDPEAMLNDPERVRSGILELAKRNLSTYERSIDLADIPAEQKKQIKDTDVVLNQRAKEYGFNWTGGAKGTLTYDPGRDDQAAKDDASTIAPIPTVQPTAPPPQAPPAVGTESDGYRFKGGDPADPNNWEQL